MGPIACTTVRPIKSLTAKGSRVDYGPRRSVAFHGYAKRSGRLFVMSMLLAIAGCGVTDAGLPNSAAEAVERTREAGTGRFRGSTSEAFGGMAAEGMIDFREGWVQGSLIVGEPESRFTYAEFLFSPGETWLRPADAPAGGEWGLATQPAAEGAWNRAVFDPRIILERLDQSRQAWSLQFNHESTSQGPHARVAALGQGGDELTVTNVVVALDPVGRIDAIEFEVQNAYSAVDDAISAQMEFFDFGEAIAIDRP